MNRGILHNLYPVSIVEWFKNVHEMERENKDKRTFSCLGVETSLLVKLFNLVPLFEASFISKFSTWVSHFWAFCIERLS